jgi:hypothetical protein
LFKLVKEITPMKAHKFRIKSGMCKGILSNRIKKYIKIKYDTVGTIPRSSTCINLVKEA